MKTRSLTLLGFLILLSGCEKSALRPAASTHPHDRPQVFAANYPVAYFAERIGGHEIDVIFDAPRGEDPAFWQPTDAQIAAFQSADLIVMNGAGYSKWADKVTLPESKIVDTAASFKPRFIEVKDTVTHNHGKQGEHSHSGTAFTTWLDFQQALEQADAICAGLQRLKPEAIEQFALNFDLLKKDLLELDSLMEAVGKKLAGKPILASHPVYQYWARRYGINLKFVLWEPEAIPVEEQITELKNILATHQAAWFVWEGEPAVESVEKLKALGLSSIVFDPSGNRPDKGSWLDVMQANVKGMEAIVGQ
jgi:zinc transport system substrate-binding protein